MEYLSEIFSWIFILMGSLLVLVGSLGLIRLPDFWSRLHAASVTDSGGVILILLGNYVLLLVDSVNAFYDTVSDIFHGDFNFIDDVRRIHLLKVLSVFSLGSVTGLVTLSNVLAFLLKYYKKITNALIIGFIGGSLGVVWPWKEKILEKDLSGNILLDSNGREIIIRYQRYFPSELSYEIFLAILSMFVGIFILILLDGYHKKK